MDEFQLCFDCLFCYLLGYFKFLWIRHFMIKEVVQCIEQHMNHSTKSKFKKYKYTQACDFMWYTRRV